MIMVAWWYSGLGIRCAVKCLQVQFITCWGCSCIAAVCKLITPVVMQYSLALLIEWWYSVAEKMIIGLAQTLQTDDIITFGLEYRNERWATVLSCIFSFSRSRDILGGIKFWNGSHDPNNASFWDDFSSAGWDLLTSTYTPNLMSLSAPVTKIWKAVQNVEIGGSLGC